MKKLSLMLLAVAAMVVSSCSKSERPDPMTYVPDDAAVVVSVKVGDIIGKAGIEVKDGKVVLPETFSSLARAENTAKLNKLVKSGIDFESRCYVYGASEKYEVGVIVPIKDKDAMRSFLEQEANMQMTEDGGVYKYEDYGNTVMISDEYMIVIDPNGSEPVSTSIITSGVINPMLDNSVAVNVVNGKSDVNVYVNYDAVKELLKKEREFKDVMEMFTEPQGIAGTSITLDFNEKSVDLKIKVLDEKGSVVKSMPQITGDPSSEGLKFIPKDIEAVLTLSLDGEKLLEIPEIEQALSQARAEGVMTPEEAKEIVGALNGPATIGVNYTGMLLNGSQIPTIYGAIKNEKCADVFAKIENMVKGIGLNTSHNGDEMAVKFQDGRTIVVGSKDGFLYFRAMGGPVTDGNSMYDEAVVRKAAESVPFVLYASATKGSSVQRLVNSFMPMLNFDAYVICKLDTGEGEMSLVLNEPAQENVLEALMQLTATVAGGYQ